MLWNMSWPHPHVEQPLPTKALQLKTGKWNEDADRHAYETCQIALKHNTVSSEQRTEHGKRWKYYYVSLV